ncbi:MAG: spoIIIJ-associated protein [Acidimicrobiaceae bacterium]|jgi:spoIIIJ-associated protein
MEWVETTGKTVEEAKEAALDQLGVHEDDAEFEVMEEPRTGLFGRTRGEARVRARVQPTSPRPKAERGNRRRRRPETAGRRSEQGGGDERPASSEDRAAASSARPDGRTSSTRRRSRGGAGRGGAGRGGSERAPRPPKSVNENDEQEGSGMDATVEEQAAIMRSFLEGLVDAFDLDATFEEDRVDEDTIELKVVGDNLGLLIGPKGQTLQSVQELARTVVQRKATGTHHGRVRIDIGGYRERRKEALARFATQVAADVAASGVAKALEPMHPADRKVVHDTVNEIDGVGTTSEGEEPRRRVVILPAADTAAAAPAPASEAEAEA